MAAEMNDQNTQAPPPEIMKELEELRIDARLGKDKHFSAADRTKYLNMTFGLPVIIINVLLGSVFFTAVFEESFRSTMGPILAFLAAALGAVHTFFNFHKSMEAHRAVGNRYIEISRRCRALIRGYQDELVTKTAAWEQLNELLANYHALNKEAEAFPPTRRDFQRALTKKELRGGDKGELIEMDQVKTPNPTPTPGEGD